MTPSACHVMAKPSGSVCNIDCKYCFYLEKEKLYPDAARTWRMSDEVLELYVKQYIEAQDVPAANFAWQGGEPTLLGVDFFRRAVELQQKYAGGKTITNAFQTNGILLDDEWVHSSPRMTSSLACRLMDRASFMTAIVSTRGRSRPSIG